MNRVGFWVNGEYVCDVDMNDLRVSEGLASEIFFASVRSAARNALYAKQQPAPQEDNEHE